MILRFGVEVTTKEETGEIVSAYFQVRGTKVFETREFAEGSVFADYDQNGYLVGIEILSPCAVTIVDRLAKHESIDVRQRTKQFMKQAGPRGLVLAV